MAGSFAPPDLFPTLPNIDGIATTYTDVGLDVSMRDPDSPTDADSNEDLYESYPPSRGDPAAPGLINPPPDAVNTSLATPKRGSAHRDITHEIRGMYRVLDLIYEQGSGGLVDKIIIAQESVEELINDLSPGAYASLTRIDFKSLDKALVKAIGVYGSKSELVKFLLSIGAVTEPIAARLLAPSDPARDRDQVLRSGLYVVKAAMPSSEIGNSIFIIYWPEDTTWDDKAMSTVRRNRTTFMRYLTKMTDQVISLVSSEHAAKLVWHTDNEEDETNPEDDSDRLVMFEVKKTVEQEESVSTRPGFEMYCPELSRHSNPLDKSADDAALVPQLLQGESSQGFMTIRGLPKTATETSFDRKIITRVGLRDLLLADAVSLSTSLDDAALKVLLDCGLRQRVPSFAEQYRLAVEENKKKYDEEHSKGLAEIFSKLDEHASDLERDILHDFVENVARTYSTLDKSRLYIRPQVVPSSTTSYLVDLRRMLPALSTELDRRLEEVKADGIKTRDYRQLKDRIIAIHLAIGKNSTLSDDERRSLAEGVLDRGPSYLKDQAKSNSWVPSFLSKAAKTFKGDVDIVAETQRIASRTGDANFLSWLSKIRAPELAEAIAEIIELAHTGLASVIERTVRKIIPMARKIQEDEFKKQLEREIRSARDNALAELRTQIIRQANEALSSQGRKSVRVERLDPVTSLYSAYNGRQDEFRLTGVARTLQDAELEYTLHPMELSEEHRHNLRMDSTFVPKPTADSRRLTYFRTKLVDVIVHAQRLERERILLVLLDGVSGQTHVHVDRVSTILTRRPMRSLHPDRVGVGCLVAFDESKRLLAICSPTKLELHVFIFDETFSSLQGYSSAVNLALWFPKDASICFSRFAPGTEEILLIDNSAQARIFSLISQQFRPATLQLPRLPDAVHCTPDGACFLASYAANLSEPPAVIAYHWATFGSSPGISLDVPRLSLRGAVVTCFVNRSSAHAVYFNFQKCTIQSTALDVTQKAAEFNFTQKGGRTSKVGSVSAHNVLIDCYADVWTRFPVIPAIRRGTFTAKSRRCNKSITFVTDRNHQAYSRYFENMVQDFIKKTRKPTTGELDEMSVTAVTFEDFLRSIDGRTWNNISTLRAGEWFADLFCLIPIHIAVCRENRFIPLANGILSPELERSLLGADVSRIVDSISFGWYESLFQTYFANKPVKVVSSMGEQSVGKSFALNHLADTSFAGSAMRTTEGVWMSVTPTEDVLVVALDFEGVHSIERSAQEDTFLVLFNTALSNLILFRNNFALGRDITNLFQSFQSSSSVLDPKANPSLFKGTLAIIIKDVVDSDKDEVTREFAVKFQAIVQEEKEANFITRMHDGKLAIIAWPVITSPSFYKLYPTLKRRLDKQASAHKTAGEFLLTMKTLMAKLKANDWGSMSQTLASHRAKTIANLLLTALRTGYSEVVPQREPLKNYDNDDVIDAPDTESIFFLPTPGQELDTRDREISLEQLVRAWNKYITRQVAPDDEFVKDLSAFLDNLVDMRIHRIRAWLDSSFSRFQAGHASIDEVYHTFNNASIDIRANVQLCKTQCSSCNLLCIQSRFHEGAHDCRTTHNCVHVCSFSEHLDDPTLLSSRGCGMRAGHSGRHLCSVNAHLCGEPCVHLGRQGCMEECIKMVGHVDEHICSTNIHMCGEPCDLKNITMPTGKKYSCSNRCHVPHDELHSVHECDARLCPIACQLCNRLCQELHLHGLEQDAVHLCGEEHLCSALCTGPGVCEISTAAQSIEATFTGKNETFQYTKYSQVANHKRCARKIAPGQTAHPERHIHSTQDKPFHFCDARCESCGYYCTLPYGHPQQEHETSHGSMSMTRWAVQGPDDTTLEVSGRKFSASDEGAPMMCNMVCLSMGRHVHIDYCRSDSDDGTLNCESGDVEHITAAMLPNPDRPKDAVTHSLFWRRTGFKDPYPRDDQANFAKCDAICPGPEHGSENGGAGQPSYCILPMFHESANPNAVPPGAVYVSNDGHAFSCNNPVIMQQAFHVIFIIDRSGSMSCRDRQPLPNAPSTPRIVPTANNRLGAVYSALYAFWSARHAAVTAGNARNAAVARRDAYSLVLFDHTIAHGPVNNFESSPDQLLDAVLLYQPDGGTNFNEALRSGKDIMEQHWSNERKPVIIFLSDGECGVSDDVIRDLCRSAVRLGKPLSFHAVSFGPDGSSTYLRRMANIAREIQDNAPVDPQNAFGGLSIPSTYSVALDTVALAETFLGLADSLRKPRGSLLR